MFMLTECSLVPKFLLTIANIPIGVRVSSTTRSKVVDAEPFVFLHTHLLNLLA